ncbi:pyruvate kinase [bacterium]|nr:pyruvate kinase [bacterium]
MKNLSATKIVSTLGPASRSEEMIRNLFRAGVTMFRINSSHDSIETHQDTLNKIRKIEKEEKAIIPVLLDLQGPKIRIGQLTQPITVNAGDIVKFKHQKTQENNIIPVDYEGIASDVSQGEKILIDDGKIQLIVEKTDGDVVYAKVLTSGEIKPRKGLNIPGGTGSIDILTETDLKYVDFAVTNDIDYLGLSFVRSKEDIIKLRHLLNKNNSRTRIISKIEKPQALENIDEIIEQSDGIMVARGDLGIEIKTEKLPIAQKTIIKKANNARKPVIVATQMLESMIDNPIPTRAETSDVANAILDGADAVMLSGETAMGKYPLEAVEIMKKIADDINSSQFVKKNELPKELLTECNPIPVSIASSVAEILKNLPKVKGIIALTATGYTPALISECRPSVPIYALCSDFKICRFMQLHNSVFSIIADDEEIKCDKESITKLNNFLINGLKLKKGDNVILTGSIPYIMSGLSTNFLKIHTVV